MTVLVGTTTDGGSADFFGSGEAVLSRYQCVSSGIIDTLSVMVTASGYTTMNLAIYADSGGVPGALLATSASTSSQAAGLKQLAITPTVAVTVGTHYWIGLLGEGGNPNYTAAAGTGERHKVVGASWPDPWGGADSTGSNTVPIAGEGTVTVDTAGVTNSAFTRFPKPKLRTIATAAL